MSKKRGQITIFIVIGVILLIIFILSLYIISKVSEKAEIAEEAETVFETTSIKSYVTSCLKEVSDKGAWIIGAHGGYIDPNVDYTYYQGEKLPYLDPNIHTLNDTEIEFSNYIIDEIETCFNFQIFEDMGFNITEPTSDLISANVTIAPKKIFVELRYPLIVEKGQSKSELADFVVNLPISLGALYVDAVNLTNEINLNQPFNLTDPANCNKYYGNGLTNIYYKRNDNGDREIIQFMDYETYEYFYIQTYIFQFAIKDVVIEGIGCIPVK
jgi:hypothetical protein